MADRNGRFEIVRTDAGHHVRIIGANGEPLMTSEVLASEKNAIANIDAVIEIIKKAPAQGLPIRILDERGEDV